MAPPLLEVRSATKVYTRGGTRVEALKHVNLVLPEQPASITAIAGESGSGKTTLGNAILGFVPLTAGQILFQGQDIAGLNRRQQFAYRRQVQAVFQDPFGVFNPFYRVRHVFDMVIKRFRLAQSKNDARAMVEDALKRVGLRGAELLEKYPHQLSGGQRQRIMVARAYLLRPRLIVADEPVSMVDASLRAMILDIMLRLRDEEGISFLYITHDLSTAYQVGNDICILYQGAVVEQGNAQEVIDHPKHRYSQLLVSSIPLPDPAVKWNLDLELPSELEETL
ncbi:MAG TPA: ABC transporter ATP-binding protein [Chloroflexota bacterium]|nr:ABC transporter ATP-binding protein [Chloroflexota bacterium]